MVYMEEKQVAEDNGKNLSHSQNECVDIEDIFIEVFEEDTSKQKFRHSFPPSDKMRTMGDDFSDVFRPRSFSDASVSSGRFGQKTWKNVDVFHSDGKTSMKVFVRRESQTILKDIEQRQSAMVDDLSAGADRPGFESMSKSPDRVLSLDNITEKGKPDPSTPPKPRLPSNYRQYLNEQLKIHHGANDRQRNFPKNLQESLSRTDRLQGRGGQNFDKNRDVNQCDKSRSTDSGSENRSKPPASSLRRGRSSVSELPLRPNSVIYRHLDQKLQSQMLRKELNTLRISKNVRKKSETMRQWLEGESRPKSAGDLHVRFADEVNIADTECPKETDQRNSNKLLPRQSKSFDLIKSHDRIVSKTDHAASGRTYQQSRVVDSARSLNEETERNDSERRESRSLASRGQGQGRSKSATALGRYKDDSRQESEWKPLAASKKSQLSSSATNLRRKQNTITKFNYSNVEHKRENVRIKYQKSGKHERVESFSPGLDDVNHQQSARTEGDNSEKDNRGGFKTDLRDIRAVGDNRSDEEKYAALSRSQSKILHTKSSSWESHLKNDDHKSKHEHSVTAYSSKRETNSDFSTKPGASLSDRMRLTFSIDKNAQNSGAQGVNKDFKLDPRSRHQAESDIPASETQSEYKVTKGAKSAHKVPNTNTGTSQQGKIVVRQCRIGADVAFGIVAVQDNSTKVSSTKPNGNGYLDGQGLVTIRMIPDEQGRFGFNVKGGADQGMPIIVSRVAPNTPADNAIPRLNEGDQVLFINGRDVSQHTHEQVVLFIRQSRESRTKELKLIVRPNAYSGEEGLDEPDFVYDPETHQISSANGGANALDLSLKLLEESLESGAALAQFEQLYRKKPGMTMNIARLETNVPKNRYRDISPYDQTRVMIKNGDNGDYINANYVNMEIPVSGILNRYIAAQGPLPTTCIDFWQMVWEQQSTLVVMLTTKVERGRTKCHQYWPDLYETSDYGHLQITCVKEEESASFAFREFNLTHVESHEERHISHMQYIAWPDHGVPDDPADFLEFVQKVRQKRVGLVEPSIVHCSAGIGRTGVLITMETAMCLIEANQSVYPLSIVRQMRDQRAMLIQTPNQYKFVCEAIIRCYNEGIVKPLPEYQQR